MRTCYSVGKRITRSERYETDMEKTSIARKEAWRYKGMYKWRLADLSGVSF